MLPRRPLTVLRSLPFRGIQAATTGGLLAALLGCASPGQPPAAPSGTAGVAPIATSAVAASEAPPTAPQSTAVAAPPTAPPSSVVTTPPASAAPAAAATNPWAEPVRDVLVQHCGRCHRGDLPTALPRALAIFDLTEPVWHARLLPGQYAGVLERIRENSAIPAEDIASVEAFVGCATGGNCPQPAAPR
jgi:hypothetical protein